MKRTVISGYCLFICLVFLIIISGCAEESEDGDVALLAPADLLPDDYDISGWRGAGIYDEASDFDSLHDLAGSEAGVFVDEGFVSAVFQKYEECINDVCSLIKIGLTSLGEAREGLISKSLLAYEHPIYQVLSLPPEPVTPIAREEIILQQREKASQHMRKIREALQ